MRLAALLLSALLFSAAQADQPTIVMTAPSPGAQLYGFSGTSYQAVNGQASIKQIDVGGALIAGWTYGSAVRGTTVSVRDYGAVCSGAPTDDGPAFSAAIAQINSLHTAGTEAVLYVPAGQCYLNGPITQFALAVPGKVKGDGSYRSFIVLGPSFSGSVFSWDEAWGSTGTGLPTYTFSIAANGAGVDDLTLISNTGYTGQSALVFYDRNDQVTLRNVDLWYFNGAAISIGTTKVKTQAYMRESKFFNVHLWHSGNSTNPAVNISTVTTSGGDATNELKFYGLDIFDSGGIGLAINNASAFSATRLIQFFGLRVEKSQGAFDLIRIGDSVNNGPVQQIKIFGLEENSIPGSAVGVHIAGTSNNLYDIAISGANISTGTGTGIQVDAGRAIHLTDIKLGSSGTQLVVGASPPVACCISLEGDFLGGLTTSIDATSTGNVYGLGGDGWRVDLTGNETANTFTLQKITPTAAAPGAGKLTFEAVTGTSGGTCKIIAYAGTSTTPVTIIDNVGSGC